MPQKGTLERIYAIVQAIPFGQVATYGQLAAYLHLPNPRQVGSALRKLPETTKVPWHRVVNAQGRISPRGKEAEKRQKERLEKEGVEFDNQGRINLSHYRWNGTELSTDCHPQ